LGIPALKIDFIHPFDTSGTAAPGADFPRRLSQAQRAHFSFLSLKQETRARYTKNAD
jgi:hypothetical protein